MSGYYCLTSPITGNQNVRRIDSIAISDIIRLYRDQEGLNVERYFTHGDDVAILECLDTGYRFYFPYETAGDEEFYKQLGANATANGHDYDRDWSDDHAIARNYILPKDSLLEIGCNTGKFLTGISVITSDVRGLEFNEIAAHRARAKGLDVVNESIEEYAERYPESHDVICAFQVLEHVTTVGSFLNASLKALRPGGRLIFSVPNNDPYFQRHNKYEVMNLPPHHVGLWRLEAFEKLGAFFEIELLGHGYSGATSFRGDLYLRARALAGIRSLPRKHSAIEKILMLIVAPVAFLGSGLAFITRKGNYGHITVVFKKPEQL